MGLSPGAWGAPNKGNADGAEGIFGNCRMRVDYGPAPGPTIKRPCAILARSVGRATNTAMQYLLMTSLPTCRWPSRSRETFDIESVLDLKKHLRRGIGTYSPGASERWVNLTPITFSDRLTPIDSSDQLTTWGSITKYSVISCFFVLFFRTLFSPTLIQGHQVATFKSTVDQLDYQTGGGWSKLLSPSSFFCTYRMDTSTHVYTCM